MPVASNDIHMAMEVVAVGAQKYLKSVHRIASVAGPAVSGATETLRLQDVTAIIGLGGVISQLATVSFDQPLLTHLLRLEMAGLGVPEAEQGQYKNEAAAEISNIIIGHSLAYLENLIVSETRPGYGISMSPPVVIENVGTMHQATGSVYTSVPLKTEFGALVISLIWPNELWEKISNKDAQLKEKST